MPLRCKPTLWLDTKMSSAVRQSLQKSSEAAVKASDPYLVPAFPLSNRIRRAVWGFVYIVFFRVSPRPFHSWRALLLRCFGAKLGKNCRIYGRARIWAPWNLVCGDLASIGDEAVVYNPEPIELGSHAIVSQQAYLCGATHDYEDPNFPLIALPISIGSYAWICARASVQPGVHVGEGAVLGLGSVATHNLEQWSVYAGIPARKVKLRVLRGERTTALLLKEGES
jgi:putative colanic acid biosynthesis acetyltransferase WcaF